jgi:hypothetical protein
MDEQEIKLKLAQYKHLQEQIEIFSELAFEFFDNFDGSEYQQGKKDGMRLALSFVTGDPSWAELNRGGRLARVRK